MKKRFNRIRAQLGQEAEELLNFLSTGRSTLKLKGETYKFLSSAVWGTNDELGYNYHIVTMERVSDNKRFKGWWIESETGSPALGEHYIEEVKPVEA